MASPMKALIVEDDVPLARNVQAGLRQHGISASVISDAADPQLPGAARSADVVILDVMLGGERDGFQVCAALRGLGTTTPILMLTARDAVPDRVRGLESGADDYLVKPFALEELAARLRVLLRRNKHDAVTPLDAGNLHFDPRGRAATVDGTLLRLTEREVALLEFLMRNLGSALAQTHIFEEVWAQDAGTASNLVEVYVGRLRRKLAEAGAGVAITALKRQGYRLEVLPGGGAGERGAAGGRDA